MSGAPGREVRLELRSEARSYVKGCWEDISLEVVSAPESRGTRFPEIEEDCRVKDSEGC